MPQCSSGDDLVLLASTTAIAMSKGMSLNDINIFSSFFSALGDNLGIIAAQQAACKESIESSGTNKISNF